MNIYLDIDGVVLASERELALHADEFLRAVLTKYPDSTYWLTTHQWRGEDRTRELLLPMLEQETVELLEKIKPTEWGRWKTEAIDFSEPFLWFDDDLFPEEEAALRQHDALDHFVKVDLARDPHQLKKLIASYL